MLPAAPRTVSNTRPIILTFNLPPNRLDKKYPSLAAFIDHHHAPTLCPQPSKKTEKLTWLLLAQPLTSKIFLSCVCFWPCGVFFKKTNKKVHNLSWNYYLYSIENSRWFISHVFGSQFACYRWQHSKSTGVKPMETLTHICQWGAQMA